MKKVLQIANGIALIGMIVVNYLAATGQINGQTIGSISDHYESLFTPASYAFSIWSLIYLGLLAFVIYQGRSLLKKDAGDEVVYPIGWWFVVTSIANILWILAWIYEYTGLSVLLMGFLLFGLIRIILRTNMELHDAPMREIAFVWWPFSLYSGWITVALIANISAWLNKIGWQHTGITEAGWTIAMILIAGVVNLAVTWTRNMREFALAGAWGLIAIAVYNWGDMQIIANTALAVAVLVIISSSMHAFRNRKSFPLT